MLVTFGVSLAMIGVGRCCAAIGHESLAHRRVGAEIDAARDVGAGNVELDRRDAGQVRSSRAVICTNSSCERPAMLTMIGTPSDAEVRQVMRDERLDAVVVEADRVEHAGGGLDRSPRRVAGARFLRDRFRQNAAEAADIDEAFHLAGIAERARGDEDRIRQPQSAELNGEINRSCGLEASRKQESNVENMVRRCDQILKCKRAICNPSRRSR